MKRFTALAAMALLSGAAGATDVGVSVSVSQPGVYGRVDIGRFPQPQIVVAQPVIIRAAAGRRRAAGAAGVPVRAAGPSEELGQALPSLWRLRSPVYFVRMTGTNSM